MAGDGAEAAEAALQQEERVTKGTLHASSNDAAGAKTGSDQFRTDAKDANVRDHCCSTYVIFKPINDLDHIFNHPELLLFDQPSIETN